jgi:hypothetical protein
MTPGVCCAIEMVYNILVDKPHKRPQKLKHKSAKLASKHPEFD